VELSKTDLHYLHLHPGQALPSIATETLSRVVVVIDAEVSTDWQDAVSDWIIAYGCRYMMAWGLDCVSWDESVDVAVHRSLAFRETPDDRFVMTTWHANEPLEEALFYCEFCARFSYDDVDLRHALILHIAPEAGEQLMRKSYADMLANNS
jgi:hypothetical protein